VPEPDSEPATDADTVVEDLDAVEAVEAVQTIEDSGYAGEGAGESGEAVADEPTDPDMDARAIGTAVVPRPRVRTTSFGTAPAPASLVDDDHAWLDQDAGPVVRPYTLVGGRARPFTSGLGLLTHIEALYAPDADLVGLQPEHRAILSLTRTALSVAELAARLDLPVGVVRVLVGDLLQANLVSTFDADAAVRAPGDDILQAVIDGLRAL
jgi:hypothetical protein